MSKAKHSIAGHNVYFVDMIDWSHNEEYTTCFDRADLAIDCQDYIQDHYPNFSNINRKVNNWQFFWG